MLTIKSAALLLARADSLDAMRPLAHVLGFTGEALRLSAGARRELGLTDHVAAARIIAGEGDLRLLMAHLPEPDEANAPRDLREATSRLAAALLQHAPTRAWCLLTIDATHRTLCIATVSASLQGTRVAALRIDRQRVLDSDADTLRTLAAVTDSDAWLRHARFADILQRDALSHRFYRALEQAISALTSSLHVFRSTTTTVQPTPADGRELALLCASRLLFLAFLEAKGWLDGRRDFLLHHTVQSLETGGRLHDRLLRPLFFGTLNTPRSRRAAVARAFGAVPFLNGGLFTPTPLERRFRRWHFHDDAITALIASVLDRYRFTAHESSATWSEAAIDPEMLGRTFESLMAPDERHGSGSYYTPPALVAHTVREALRNALPEAPLTLFDHPIDQRPTLDANTATRLRQRLLTLRILDPACGSGAFLVHTLERLDQLLGYCDDPRESHQRRRDLLTRTIFGVDRQPIAVWLCELRLWLSVVIDCHETDISRIPPLPNLDHQIRVGDSLAGGTFQFSPPSGTGLTTLRTRYSRASGARKITLAAQLDREERQQAIAELDRRRVAIRHERATRLAALRTRDLFGIRPKTRAADREHLTRLRTTARDMTAQRRRLTLGAALPFRFGVMFADVAANQGYDLVIGNPPWVRPHALPAATRRWLRDEFRAMRHATWHEGATRAGAGPGFGAQPDLAVAFTERAMQLLTPGGTMALLLPAKLWHTLSGGGVRRLLLDQMRLTLLHDWSDAPALFDAATYPSLVVATRTHAASDPPPTTPSIPGVYNTPLSLTLHDTPPPQTSTTTTASPVRIAITRTTTTQFTMAPHALPLGGESGAPWVLLPPRALAAFEQLRTNSIPLAHSAFGRPLLGVKCGCNAAFVVHAVEHDDDTATITSLGNASAPPQQGVIERALLRPVLRGEDIGRRNSTTATATTTGDALRIIWTHDPLGQPHRTLPPAATRWLLRWRPRLANRRDARQRHRWWTLFRIEAARADCARLAWADIGRTLRTRVLLPGDPTVPLNSCYVVRAPHTEDIYALNAIMHSAIANAWLDVLAEPARGGFRRFLGWTVATLPLPTDWHAARPLLASLGRQLADAPHAAQVIDPADFDQLIAQAYRLPLDDLQPLLDWYRQ